jgi:hypothetical protein
MRELAATRRTSGVSADAACALGFAERIATVCTRVLGAIVGSVILHGSPALGDDAPEHDDIDLLALIDRPLSTGVPSAISRSMTSTR